MPGPLNKSRQRGADTGSSDPKARQRLKRRIDAFKEPSNVDRQNGLWPHKPGSENRKK